MNISEDTSRKVTCTISDSSVCKNCALASKLKCRFSWSDLGHFYLLFFVIVLPPIIALLSSGYAWVLVAWFAFAMFFFNVWESHILCRHCPYYAEESRILHCIANYGIFKPFRFNPAPMSRSEKIQTLIGFALLFGIPIPFMIAAGQWIMLLLMVVSSVMWLVTMQKYVCSTCVNFSCPLNRVPKPVVDAYLLRNPVMRQAWEASGWQIEAQPKDEYPTHTPR